MKTVLPSLTTRLFIFNSFCFATELLKTNENKLSAHRRPGAIEKETEIPLLDQIAEL